jgi:glucose-6-phosphate 1-epimerase
VPLLDQAGGGNVPGMTETNSQTVELNKQFGVPGVVQFEAGRGSLTRVAVTCELATAEIYLHGAHVTQFQPRGCAPLLFISKSSWFDATKPIRGGVPLVFPWFGPRAGHPESPAHGFARIKAWRTESCDVRGDGSVRLVLILSSDDQTLHHWPHSFALRMVIIISRSLDITLEVRNLSQQPMDFEEALHTYLRVGDVRQAYVEGLDGLEYVDKVDGGHRKPQPPMPIRFTGETDRVYLKATKSCVVHDPVLKRIVTVEKEGSNATVVWNPWIAKAKAMPDFGDEEWPEMLCIEAANALDCAVKLPANATHRMGTRLSIL